MIEKTVDRQTDRQAHGQTRTKENGGGEGGSRRGGDVEGGQRSSAAISADILRENTQQALGIRHIHGN